MINFYGLRRRQTYDEVIDYLHNRQDTLRFPKRIRFKTDRLLYDLASESLNRLDQERKQITKEDKGTQTEPLTVDRGMQTEPYTTDRGMQTDPYMFDKSTQQDDGVNYDQYYDGSYIIIPETAERFNTLTIKTQTRRFRKVIKQVRQELRELQQIEYPEAEAEELSLWNALFGWSPTQNNYEDDDPEPVPATPTPPPTPELILHYSPPSPELAPLPPPSYPPPPDRGRERATSSRDPQWADVIDDIAFKYNRFFFDFL